MPGSPYSQPPDIKPSLPYHLQRFRKCLQDSVGIRFRPSRFTSHPPPSEDAHWARQKHFLEACCVSSNFSCLVFPMLLWVPHVGTLPSPQRSQALGLGPYPDPWTQGTTAGCQGGPWTCAPKWCACVLVAWSCPTLCDPMDHSPPAPPSAEFSRQEHWRGLPFPSPGCVCENT